MAPKGSRFSSAEDSMLPGSHNEHSEKERCVVVAKEAALSLLIVTITQVVVALILMTEAAAGHLLACLQTQQVKSTIHFFSFSVDHRDDAGPVVAEANCLEMVGAFDE